MPILNEFQKGYLSGLLDGEGSICLQRKKEARSRLGFSMQLHLTIHNTNLDLLINIQKMIDGKIYRRLKEGSKCISKTGVVYYRQKAVYVCQLSNKEKILELLEQLCPYLIVQKNRALKAIEFCKSRLNRPSFKAGYTDSEIQTLENWKDIHYYEKEQTNVN